MTIIIGAGPAGLGAALALSKPALILERNGFAGKKLLLSGSGQCNVTNAAEGDAFLARLGEFRAFLKPAFYQFSNRDLMRLLEDAGCPLFTRDDGKVFPVSRHSADVRNTLLKLVAQKGHRIVYNCNISSVVKTNLGFELKAESGNSYSASRLILAAGGAAYPDTGSDGSGYAIAKSLGLRVLQPRSALAAVQIKGFEVFKTCAGLSMPNIILKLNKRAYQGDLLFTHQGFSGPLILDNSYRMNSGDRIALVFDGSGSFESMLARQARKKTSTILHSLGMAHALCDAVLKHLGISDLTASELGSTARKRLKEWLRHAEFEIHAVAGLQSAMSDFGGVDLKEVKASSMQPRELPGLYLAGETLSYCLPSGGFSIQMALATGYLAGKKSE